VISFIFFREWLPSYPGGVLCSLATFVLARPRADVAIANVRRGRFSSLPAYYYNGGCARQQRLLPLRPHRRHARNCDHLRNIALS